MWNVIHGYILILNFFHLIWKIYNTTGRNFILKYCPRITFHINKNSESSEILLYCSIFFNKYINLYNYNVLIIFIRLSLVTFPQAVWFRSRQNCDFFSTTYIFYSIYFIIQFIIELIFANTSIIEY
jgi:hypothetical protein